MVYVPMPVVVSLLASKVLACLGYWMAVEIILKHGHICQRNHGENLIFSMLIQWWTNDTSQSCLWSSSSSVIILPCSCVLYITIIVREYQEDAGYMPLNVSHIRCKPLNYWKSSNNLSTIIKLFSISFGRPCSRSCIAKVHWQYFKASLASWVA